jgi:hypothetical protein
MTDAVEPTGGGEAPAPSPVETATAGLATLSADKAFQADWSGENGRPAQIAAVALKAQTTRAAFNPEPDTAPVLPDALAAAVDDPNATEATRARVEGMIPGQSVEDYTFRFEGAADMGTEELQEMTATAQEAALAMGANPAYARATIEFIDTALSRNPEPATEDQVIDALNTRHGLQAKATVRAASATVAKMPEHSRQWLFDALDSLDANSQAWAINRLASIHRANN